jgi:hypothetical protein
MNLDRATTVATTQFTGGDPTHWRRGTTCADGVIGALLLEATGLTRRRCGWRSAQLFLLARGCSARARERDPAASARIGATGQAARCGPAASHQPYRRGFGQPLAGDPLG